MGKNKWQSKVGRDCISLDTSLCRWLGKRLLFLAKNGSGVPQQYIDLVQSMHPEDRDTEYYHKCWRRELRAAGDNLIRYGSMWDQNLTPEEGDRLTSEAQGSLRWVAQWLPNLWD